MKHIFVAAAAVFLTIFSALPAFAHSHLESSNPKDGDVITTALQEVVLTFDGKIEQGSFIDVTLAGGEAVAVQETVIGDGTLTAKFEAPLANAAYDVAWSIISADGHPLEGTFSFTVDVPATATTTEQEAENEVETAVEEPQEDAGNTFTIPLVVGLIAAIIVGGGMFLLTKRKQ